MHYKIHQSLDLNYSLVSVGGGRLREDLLELKPEQKLDGAAYFFAKSDQRVLLNNDKRMTTMNMNMDMDIYADTHGETNVKMYANSQERGNDPAGIQGEPIYGRMNPLQPKRVSITEEDERLIGEEASHIRYGAASASSSPESSFASSSTFTPSAARVPMHSMKQNAAITPQANMAMNYNPTMHSMQAFNIAMRLKGLEESRAKMLSGLQVNLQQPRQANGSGSKTEQSTHKNKKEKDDKLAENKKRFKYYAKQLKRAFSTRENMDSTQPQQKKKKQKNLEEEANKSKPCLPQKLPFAQQIQGLGPYDVLWEEGIDSHLNLGNRRLLVLLFPYIPRYMKCEKMPIERNRIIQALIKAVYDAKGQFFLKKNCANGDGNGEIINHYTFCQADLEYCKAALALLFANVVIKQLREAADAKRRKVEEELALSGSSTRQIGAILGYVPGPPTNASWSIIGSFDRSHANIWGESTSSQTQTQTQTQTKVVPKHFLKFNNRATTFQTIHTSKSLQENSFSIASKKASCSTNLKEKAKPQLDSEKAPVHTPYTADRLLNIDEGEEDNTFEGVEQTEKEGTTVCSEELSTSGSKDDDRPINRAVIAASKNTHSKLRMMTPLPEHFKPGPHDVVCQKGAKGPEFPGNDWFVKLIEFHLYAYTNAENKRCKSAIVTKVLKTVRELGTPGAGFVRLSPDGIWCEVGDHLAREKIGQHFRDRLFTKYSSSSKFKLAKRNFLKVMRGEKFRATEKLLENVNNSFM